MWKKISITFNYYIVSFLLILSLSSLLLTIAPEGFLSAISNIIKGRYLDRILLSLVIFLSTATLSFIFFRKFESEDDTKRRIELLRKEQHENIKDIQKGITYTLQNKNYTQERYLPEIYKEIPYLISQSVRKEINNILPNIIRKELSELKNNEINIYNPKSSTDESLTEINNSSDSELLIRQLSHALFTPLSQIEASRINMSTFIEAANSSEDRQLLSSLDTINSSINICKSTLIAYRELTNISGSSNLWTPECLSKMLEESGNVYRKKLNRNIGLEIDLPQSIEEYSNNHISALLFPVLENAIEASKENSVVVIKGSQIENMFEITIENSAISPPPSDEIYKDGYTTKHNQETEKRHQGTGLTITQNLLSAYRDTSINHEVNGDTVTFKIKLPTRIENEN